MAGEFWTLRCRTLQNLTGPTSGAMGRTPAGAAPPPAPEAEGRVVLGGVASAGDPGARSTWGIRGGGRGSAGHVPGPRDRAAGPAGMVAGIGLQARHGCRVHLHGGALGELQEVEGRGLVVGDGSV